MYRLTITPEELAQVTQVAHSHPHQIIRRRALTIVLTAQGLPRHQVAGILQIATKTIREHLALYRSAGLAGLLTLQYQPSPGALDTRHDQILAVLEAHPPATIKEAQATIAAHTQLTRGATQVRLFLKKIGVSAGKSANSRTKRTATHR